MNLKNVSNCYVTPNNEYLVTMIGNKTLTIWNTQSRTQIENHEVGWNFRYNLRAINGTRDSKYIFFQKEISEVIQWSCETQSDVHTFQHAEQVQDLCVSSDNKYLYSVCENAIYKWDLETKTLLHKIEENAGYNLFCILSEDDKRLYVNGAGADIYEWDADKDGKQPARPFDIIQDAGWVRFDLAPDSNTLIQTSQYNGSFWVVDLKGKKVTHNLNKHRGVINMLAFTADGNFLISRSPSETVIWDTRNWKNIITIEEDFGVVTSSANRAVAFIHDGIYKIWTEKVLADFSDEYQFEDKNEQTDGTIKEEDIKLTGALNQITPLLISQMAKKQKGE